jgi:hypothetical protein
MSISLALVERRKYLVLAPPAPVSSGGQALDHELLAFVAVIGCIEGAAKALA